MKRILVKLFRNIEQKNKRQLINELLTLDSTIEESVLLFKNVKADFLFKLSQKEEQNKKENELIESLKDSKIVHNLYDMEVTDFHLVSPEKI